MLGFISSPSKEEMMSILITTVSSFYFQDGRLSDTVMSQEGPAIPETPPHELWSLGRTPLSELLVKSDFTASNPSNIFRPYPAEPGTKRKHADRKSALHYEAHGECRAAENLRGVADVMAKVQGDGRFWRKVVL